MATSDLIGLPRVTVSEFRDRYRMTVEISGLAAKRTISAEERRDGIESLSPPTVVARSRFECIRLAQRAVAAAIMSTDGSLTPSDLGAIGFTVDWAARNAFEKLGIES